jgi:hypothetical protein
VTTGMPQLPGPTWPNRMFVYAGSSGGLDHSPTNQEIVEWDLHKPSYWNSETTMTGRANSTISHQRIWANHLASVQTTRTTPSRRSSRFCPQLAGRRLGERRSTRGLRDQALSKTTMSSRIFASPEA